MYRLGAASFSLHDSWIWRKFLTSSSADDLPSFPCLLSSLRRLSSARSMSGTKIMKHHKEFISTKTKASQGRFPLTRTGLTDQPVWKWNASVLPNFASSELRTKLATLPRLATMARTDAFYLWTGYSDRPVLTNGKRPRSWLWLGQTTEYSKLVEKPQRTGKKNIKNKTKTKKTRIWQH